MTNFMNECILQSLKLLAKLILRDKNKTWLYCRKVMAQTLMAISRGFFFLKHRGSLLYNIKRAKKDAIFTS